MVIPICEDLPRCKNLCNFFFVSLVHAEVWLLFKGPLALVFSLFYVTRIRGFDWFLRQG